MFHCYIIIIYFTFSLHYKIYCLFTLTLLASIEKSTVVLGASIILFWMFQVWIPEARILVPLNSPFVDFLVSCIYFYGWGYALYTASDVDLYELLGVKKVSIYF